MQNKTHSVGLYWFRDDCRLSDMPALLALSQQVDFLLCVYVVDQEWFKPNQWQTQAIGKIRWQFICQGLSELSAKLQQLGQQLLIIDGSPVTVLSELVARLKVSHLGFAEHCGVYEGEHFNQISNIHPTLKLVSACHSQLYDEKALPFELSDLPDSFSAFRRKVEKHAIITNCTAEITSLPPPPDIVPEFSLSKAYKQVSSNPLQDNFKGGESAAQRQVAYYLIETDLVANYKQTRNAMLGWDYSTKLSAWLNAGHISPKYVYWQLTRYEQARQANESTYWVFFELLWREFFYWHMQKYGKQLFAFAGIRGNKPNTAFDADKFDQWANGNTGYAIVDACMRQLNASGFISNRGRQLVASCFVHELALDWRYGAAYFEQQLIDYHVASNYGNWQYLAGVGCDPRGHRQFNLAKQSEQYDGDGAFRRHWLGAEDL